MRVGQDRPNAVVSGGPLQDDEGTGEGSPAESTLGVRDKQADVLAGTPVCFAGLFLNHQGPEVARDRVKPAAVHKPGPCLPGLLVIPVDDAPKPGDLSRQVAVVRSVSDAGLNERGSVLG